MLSALFIFFGDRPKWDRLHEGLSVRPHLWAAGVGMRRNQEHRPERHRWRKTPAKAIRRTAFRPFLSWSFVPMLAGVATVHERFEPLEGLYGRLGCFIFHDVS